MRSGRANPRFRQLLGAAAEELAARHLQRHGCEVLERRYRTRSGEIDLIVRDRGTIAFVEVKARRSDRYGTSAEAVTGPKQRRLVNVARAYLRHRGADRQPCRFDVVAVRLRKGRASVRWLRDAFRP